MHTHSKEQLCPGAGHFRLFPLRMLGWRCNGAGSVAACPKSPGVPAAGAPNKPPPPPNRPGAAACAGAAGCAPRPEKKPVDAGAGDGAAAGGGPRAKNGEAAVAGACMGWQYLSNHNKGPGWRG